MQYFAASADKLVNNVINIVAYFFYAENPNPDGYNFIRV